MIIRKWIVLSKIDNITTKLQSQINDEMFRNKKNIVVFAAGGGQ